MPALQDFLKEQAKEIKSPLNLVFLPGMAKDIANADNKLKALVKTMADWFFWTTKLLAPLRNLFIGGAIILGVKSLGTAIQNLVRETGSLQAALQRLQTFQLTARGLAPFLGGLQAARMRVAELATLSQRGPFSFPEIAEANRSLQVFTRGAYSSAEATRAIGDAAIATGNSIGSVADATGNFYQTMREGRPIDSATESLRQLGVISQPVADDLVSMAKGGAQSIEVFNRFTDALSSFSTAAKSTKDDLATVSAEHEKAAEELKVAFGAPWTASDVQNTKNMTAAMQAVTPAIGNISKSFAVVFNGFSTMRSEITKLIAQSPLFQQGLQGVGKGISVLAVAATAAATVALPLLIPKIGALVTTMLGARLAATALGTVLTGTLGAGVIGVAILGATMLAGALVGVVHEHREATREATRMARAFKEADEAVRSQIAGATSLTQHHDALAAAINNVITAQEALNRAQKEGAGKSFPGAVGQRNPNAFPGGFAITGQLIGSVFSGDVPDFIAGTKQERAAKAGLANARKTFKEAQQRIVPGLSSPEQDRIIEQALERRQADEESGFQARMTGGGPREQLNALRDQERLLRDRSKEGEAAVKAAAPIATQIEQKEIKRAPILLRQSQLEKELAATQAEPDKAIGVRPGQFLTKDKGTRVKEIEHDLKGVNRELATFEGKELNVRAKAPANTSIRQFAEAEIIKRGIEAGAAAKVAAEPGATAEAKEKAKEAKAASGGVVISEAGKALALEQMNADKMEGMRLQKLEQENVELRKQADAMVAQTKELERQVKLEESRAHTHLAIASLTGEEEDVARATFDLEQKQLDIEIALAKQKPGNQAEVEELEARKQANEVAEHDRRITVAQNRTRIATEEKIATSRSKAAGEGKASGDTARAEYKLRQESIDKEIALEATKKVPNQAKIEELKTQKEVNRTNEEDRFRSLAVSRTTSDIEIKKKQDRRLGNVEDKKNLENQEDFMQRLEQHRSEGMTQDEASARAMEETEEDIRNKAPMGGLPAVASSLGKIAMGGGVYAPGGDPSVAAMKQIVVLHQKANTYLQILADEAKKGGVD